MSDADEVTNKYGLEAGLWSVFKSNDDTTKKGATAKELLTRYGRYGSSRDLAVRT